MSIMFDSVFGIYAPIYNKNTLEDDTWLECKKNLVLTNDEYVLF